MPFVQLFSTSPFGTVNSSRHRSERTAAGVAETLATALDCAPEDILVQIFTAAEGSAPSAIAIIRGRPRARMAEAVQSLETYLAEWLELDRSSLLVRFEPTLPITPPETGVSPHTAERSD